MLKPIPNTNNFVYDTETEKVYQIFERPWMRDIHNTLKIAVVDTQTQVTILTKDEIKEMINNAN